MFLSKFYPMDSHGLYGVLCGAKISTIGCNATVFWILYETNVPLKKGIFLRIFLKKTIQCLKYILNLFLTFNLNLPNHF